MDQAVQAAEYYVAQEYGSQGAAAGETAGQPGAQPGTQVPGAEADPFAHLRAHEQQQQQEQHAWAEWYRNYTAWYQTNQSTQPQPATNPAGDAPSANASNVPGKAAPNAKPILDPNFEENRNVYLMKSGIQREMETMIEQGAGLDVRQKAIRKLQFQWHPDKNPDDAEMAKDIFQFIEESRGWFLDGAT